MQRPLWSCSWTLSRKLSNDHSAVIETFLVGDLLCFRKPDLVFLRQDLERPDDRRCWHVSLCWYAGLTLDQWMPVPGRRFTQINECLEVVWWIGRDRCDVTCALRYYRIRINYPSKSECGFRKKKTSTLYLRCENALHGHDWQIELWSSFRSSLLLVPPRVGWPAFVKFMSST